MNLPLLLGVPVLALLGVAAVILLGPHNAPTPHAPAPNVSESDPPATHPPRELPPPHIDQPPPQPEHPHAGTPDNVADADAMLEEARAAMRRIRGRLELKYKYAGYELDRNWTLDKILRHPERLNGKYFEVGDFALSFDPGKPLVVIGCKTHKGEALPDGELSLSVDLSNGRSTEQGSLFAHVANGVLLPDDARKEAVRILQRAVVTHMRASSKTADGVAGKGLDRSEADGTSFSPDDFTCTISGKTAAFACRTIKGRKLARPLVVTVDYAARNVKLSGPWMRMKSTRDSFIQYGDYYLHLLAVQIAEIAKRKDHPRAVRLGELNLDDWFFNALGICPFDLKIEIGKDDPLRVTLSVATYFGQPLPFKELRYVAVPDQKHYGFEPD